MVSVRGVVLKSPWIKSKENKAATTKPEKMSSTKLVNKISLWISEYKWGLTSKTQNTSCDIF